MSQSSLDIPFPEAKSLAGVQIHKDECVWCFKCSRDAEGIFVDLTNFQGFCTEHAQRQFEQTGNPFFLNMKYTLKEKEGPQEPQKITKLAVGKPGGIDFSDDEWEL